MNVHKGVYHHIYPALRWLKRRMPQMTAACRVQCDRQDWCHAPEKKENDMNFYKIALRQVLQGGCQQCSITSMVKSGEPTDVKIGDFVCASCLAELM